MCVCSMLYLWLFLRVRLRAAALGAYVCSAVLSPSRSATIRRARAFAAGAWPRASLCFRQHHAISKNQRLGVEPEPILTLTDEFPPDEGEVLESLEPGPFVVRARTTTRVALSAAALSLARQGGGELPQARQASCLGRDSPADADGRGRRGRRGRVYVGVLVCICLCVRVWVGGNVCSRRLRHAAL